MPDLTRDTAYIAAHIGQAYSSVAHSALHEAFFHYLKAASLLGPILQTFLETRAGSPPTPGPACLHTAPSHLYDLPFWYWPLDPAQRN